MNQHFKRGLIASVIAFGVIASYGAMDIFFDPPVDVPSVGYWAYWLLVKAVLAIGIGFGFFLFILTLSGSWLIANIQRNRVKMWTLGLLILTGLPIFLITGYQMLKPPIHCEYPLPPPNK